MIDAIALALFGAVTGAINSLAGGGSFVLYPALLAFGTPPVHANATNTLASLPGYVTGAVALRKEIPDPKRPKASVAFYVAVALLGGLLGGLLLIKTSNEEFRVAVPWLMLFAFLALSIGDRVSNQIAKIAENAVGGENGKRPRAAKTLNALGNGILAALLLAICTYGGFFNAGLGFLLLAWTAAARISNPSRMNGIKLLCSSSASLIAATAFILDGKIAWSAAIPALIGAAVGGYAAAKISRRAPPKIIKRIVIAASGGVTAFFFHDVYFA